jgi:hypothetical protein
MADKSKTIKAAGEPHKVFKKDGKIIVDHVNKKGGKWDKINLTSKAGAKTIKQGVKAVKKYHKNQGR